MSTPITMAALAAACAIAAAGCEATFTPVEPVVTIERGPVVARVTSVPTDIWAYPHVFFGSSNAYLVNGFWYQMTPSGWIVFRREPPELSRARVRIYASPRFRGQRAPAYGYPAPEPPLQEPNELGRERTPNP